MEIEAHEALLNLEGITEDISMKTQRYESRILENQLRLRNQFQHQAATYNEAENICAQKRFSASLKEVNKLKLINKKLGSIQERTDEMTDFHRSQFTEKVYRAKEAHQGVEQERLKKINLEKSRSQHKEALKTEILSHKQIENLKKAEENRLRSLDAS